MRIVAGRNRGRRLATLPGDGPASLRPTSDRTREALFNVLQHRFQGVEGWSLHGARGIDLFAGTGALGLEALSRGASQITFVERDRASLACLGQNLAALAAPGEATVLAQDATRLPLAPAPCSLALLDPPYGKGLLRPALESLAGAGWLAEGAIIAAEHPAEDALPTPPPGFLPLDSRRYGKAVVTFWRYTRAEVAR